ncbi:ArsR/SmtB family transcription factor [Sphingomonas sp. CLY1604]|uniref:ArsR/SmtB family transcription factor n=1 Tax=Sphingomonas sp. CLY1604 TaxID=3457786 RepID=UPI003FD6CB0D
MQAMRIMSALAQSTRLDVWRLLVSRRPEGMMAGDIARAVGLSKNGMSPHFTILSAAGLISSEKIGRSIVYKASIAAVEELSSFLAAACDEGRRT